MKRTGRSTQAEMLNQWWQHDITKEVFKTRIALKVPSRKYNLEWFDAIVGSKSVVFKNSEGRKVTLTMSQGVRCVDCPGVIAFDSEGKGVVFLK